MISGTVGEMVARFVLGGLIVSVFAVIAEMLRPKSFAGLLGAAPSVALATLGLVIAHNGKEYAATEARSMILGSIAFFIYASVANWVLLRFKPPAIVAASGLVPLWLGVAVALWFLTSH